MNSRRIIESAMGQRMAIDILPGSDGIRLSRIDAPAADQVVLDGRASRILAAYLGSAMVVNRANRPPEEIDDEHGTVLTTHEEPSPHVRITQGRRALHVHSPSWEALRCEIDLVVPRLLDRPLNNQSRH